MLKPPDLVGHISLSLSLGASSDARDVIPVKPVLPFQRMRDPKTREMHEVSVLLPARGSVCFILTAERSRPDMICSSTTKRNHSIQLLCSSVTTSFS